MLLLTFYLRCILAQPPNFQYQKLKCGLCIPFPFHLIIVSFHDSLRPHPHHHVSGQIQRHDWHRPWQHVLDILSLLRLIGRPALVVIQ